MRAKLPVEEGFVDRDGVKLHYEVYGTGAETMVFVPPWSIAHSRVYKAQLPYFSERFRCVTYDGRGNGQSDRPDDVAAYTLDNYVADALAVIDATRTGPAIVCGLSFGAMIACVLAAYHAERVKAAILVGTAAMHRTRLSLHGKPPFSPKRSEFEDWDKYNYDYWLSNYPDFAAHFIRNIFLRTTFDQAGRGRRRPGLATPRGRPLPMTVDARTMPPAFDLSEAMYRKIKCPLLMIHGDNDRIQPHDRAQLVAELTGAELVTIQGGGHNPLGRIPAKCNTLIADFLDRRLGMAARPKAHTVAAESQARTISVLANRARPRAPGHRHHTRIAEDSIPDLQVDWLAQDPVTRLLEASGEHHPPLQRRLASETRHIELESGEHDLHAFQAIRRMDEVLIANFMIFQDAVEERRYDLVIADEAWDIDHYWHEHPELKKAALAWFTDFVGFVPMPSGGEHEAFLTTDYNAEMIEHIERHPGVRDRVDICRRAGGHHSALFRQGSAGHARVGAKTFRFRRVHHRRAPTAASAAGSNCGRRSAIRSGREVCIVTVGGSGVVPHLIKRILQSWPMAEPSSRNCA